MLQGGPLQCSKQVGGARARGRLGAQSPDFLRLCAHNQQLLSLFGYQYAQPREIALHRDPQQGIPQQDECEYPTAGESDAFTRFQRAPAAVQLL